MMLTCIRGDVLQVSHKKKMYSLQFAGKAKIGYKMYGDKMNVCHTQKTCHSFLFEACGFVCETIVSVFSYPRWARCFFKHKDNLPQGGRQQSFISWNHT